MSSNNKDDMYNNRGFRGVPVGNKDALERYLRESEATNMSSSNDSDKYDIGLSIDSDESSAPTTPRDDNDPFRQIGSPEARKKNDREQVISAAKSVIDENPGGGLFALYVNDSDLWHRARSTGDLNALQKYANGQVEKPTMKRNISKGGKKIKRTIKKRRNGKKTKRRKLKTKTKTKTKKKMKTKIKRS